MIEVKAPNPYSDNIITIFLGGSIEMGIAEPWQQKLVDNFKNHDILFLNPRRTDWDSSWEQNAIEGTPFYEQVKWELDGQDNSDFIVYYFDPNTKSPITLLELGSYGTSNSHNVIVCCPDGFWRKGNVEMFCKKHNITLVNTFTDLVTELKGKLK